ncbi:hypothetical protein GJAV_G00029640 [Gymnothorax javanicus]|nr:hypothetical protein GJAV_G00029640 [Gymnothorax javanicus]
MSDGSCRKFRMHDQPEMSTVPSPSGDGVDLELLGQQRNTLTATMSTDESQMKEQLDLVQKCESGTFILRPVHSCIKRWLLFFLNVASNKRRQGPDSSPRRRERLLLAIIILFGLTVMILLLLWNYQCLFVEHLCRGHEESSEFPVFGGRESSSSAGS